MTHLLMRQRSFYMQKKYCSAVVPGICFWKVKKNDHAMFTRHVISNYACDTTDRHEDNIN